MNPFEYLNSINYSKKDIMVDDVAEKEYNSFLINRGLSYFPDTVLFANEMNTKNHIDNRLKFSFLINIVRKRKRFSKWNKRNENEDISILKEYYGYSDEKARVALSLLSSNEMKQLKERLFKGGTRK